MRAALGEGLTGPEWIGAAVLAVAEAAQHRAARQRAGDVPGGSYTRPELCRPALECEAGGLAAEYGGHPALVPQAESPRLVEPVVEGCVAAVCSLLRQLFGGGGGASSARLKYVVTGLLGSWLLWHSMDRSDESNSPLDRVQRLCRAHLDRLSSEVEQGFFRANAVGDRFRAVPSGTVPPTVPLRQDLHGGVPVPEGFGEVEEDGFQFLLQALAAAADPAFQQVSAAAVMPTGGRVKHASVKSRNRCWLKRQTDYADDDPPKAARICDVIRNAVTFDTPGAMLAGLDELIAVFGPPLKVKNNMDPGFDAMRKTFGYRSIIVFFKFEPGQLWGGLLDQLEPHVTDALERSIKQLYSDEFASRIAAALAEPELRARPASICVEVQLMLAEYLALRQESHLPYKTLRVSSWQGLHTEFAAGTIHRADTMASVVSSAYLE